MSDRAIRNELFGYLLGALDENQEAAVEQAVAENPALRRDLNRIRNRLGSLPEARRLLAPPPGLAQRTCQMVQRRERERPVRLPAEPAYAPHPAQSRWSLADMVVVAGVLLAAAAVFLPALASSRHEARVRVCQNHLWRLGVALQTFSDQWGGQFFPYVPTEGPQAYAGYYATVLAERQLVDRPNVFICPESPLVQIADWWAPPSEQELDAADPETLERLQQLGGGSYGYSLGQIVDGRHRPPRNLGRSHFALMADQPAWRNGRCASANHAGRGFNVLFEDGRVQYFVGPVTQTWGDDPFLSLRRRVEPGWGENDAVIGASATRPLLDREAMEHSGAGGRR